MKTLFADPLYIPILVFGSVLVTSTVYSLNYDSHLSISNQLGKKLGKIDPNYVGSPINLDIGISHLQNVSHQCRSRIPGLSSYNDKMGLSLARVLRLLGKTSQGNLYGWKLNLDHEVYVQNVSSELKQSYVERLEREYRGQVHRVDFKRNASGVIDGINANIAKATNNLIREVIQPNTLDNDTELVITNSLYFKAKWLTPFASTVIRVFNGTKETAPVHMLTGRDTGLKILERDDYRVLVKSYNATDGLIFVAAQNLTNERKHVKLTFPVLREALTNPFVTGTLTIPVIKQETNINLLETMKSELKCIINRGIPGIIEGRNLKVNRLSQKIRFETTTEGSEGAAVLTSELGDRFGDLEPENEYVFDKPFNYYVMHNTGAILFSGRYAGPKPSETIE